ncbi:MAG: GTPase domain-containing protein [Candidatus Aminicenantes bacterium]|nr:GTPase domain-containing protein [Candidatus Aminicenantes bacterium]
MKVVNGKTYLKIVFFGTALAGKTTTLKWLFRNGIPDEFKLAEKVRCLETSFGQTLFFDFTPLQISADIIVRLYTTTGQNYYTMTRRLLFEDVDGVFFVADSRKEELEHNREFVREMRSFQKGVAGMDRAEIILLCNKQDQEDVYSPDELAALLDLSEYTRFPASALNGTNLREAFVLMISRLLKKIHDGEAHALS